MWDFESEKYALKTRYWDSQWRPRRCLHEDEVKSFLDSHFYKVHDFYICHPTFVSVYWEKICKCARFTKILANYISEESLINNKCSLQLKYNWSDFLEVSGAGMAKNDGKFFY